MGRALSTDRLAVTGRIRPQAIHLLRILAIALVGGLNLWLLLLSAVHLADPASARDFLWITDASQRLWSGLSPYDVPYRWSPVIAATWPVLAWLGPWSVRLLDAAALLLLPRKAALLVAVSWPFWFDLELGNVNTLMLVAAWLAVRGRPAPFLVGALLIPRPLYLPVLAWVLWRQPAWRRRFAVMAVVSLVVAAPWLVDWARSVLWIGGFDMANDWNIGPSHVIGIWWIPIGLTLAAFLTWKGRLGLASLAASSYVLPYYYLMGFLELRQAQLDVAGRVVAVIEGAGTDVAGPGADVGADRIGV